MPGVSHSPPHVHSHFCVLVLAICSAWNVLTPTHLAEDLLLFYTCSKRTEKLPLTPPDCHSLPFALISPTFLIHSSNYHKYNVCRYPIHASILGLPWWLSWLRIHLQCGRAGFDLWVGKIPWRRERLPIPVFWPGEFHGL